MTLAACGTSAPPPSTVRARIASDLGNVLHETKAASDATTTNLPTGSGAQLLNLGLGSSTAGARVGAALASIEQRFAPRTTRQSKLTTSGFDPDATIQWLNDNIFTDANNRGDGIYQVPPELFCTTTTVDSLGNPVSTVDQDCVTRVTTADLRVRVEENDSTLRFAIQVDANHDEPLAFGLSHTSLSITIDLDGADRAMVALAQAFGDQAPDATLSGQITGELQVLGSAHAKVSLSIDRDIAISAGTAGGDPTRFTSAAAHVFSLELDGNAPLLALDLGLGETTLHTPADAAAGTPSSDVDLAGLTANATYAGGDTLSVDNISLGTKTTTIAHNGVRGLAIDLNPADGRSLSATLTGDPATGATTVAVSPRLDLQIATDHGVLGDTPPVYDITRVQLEGSLTGDAASSSVRVTGSYSLATNPAQYGFSATTGQCVTSTDTVDSTSGQSYTAYSVGACN
ncbi:MAG: hypothetical protein ACM31C_09930 [Acidobacteriota bacterium]